MSPEPTDRPPVSHREWNDSSVDHPSTDHVPDHVHCNGTGLSRMRREGEWGKDNLKSPDSVLATRDLPDLNARKCSIEYIDVPKSLRKKLLLHLEGLPGD